MSLPKRVGALGVSVRRAHVILSAYEEAYAPLPRDAARVRFVPPEALERMRRARDTGCFRQAPSSEGKERTRRRGPRRSPGTATPGAEG
ncbi:hypothetical protein [Thermus scotoductus]|nr:hypothetical protein [Thermus scotoductus]